jgi:DNA-binding transcriptional ArsR family regulator
MNDYLSTTFTALGDPTRRAILARLASGEASVTELAEPFAMSMPAISKHLKVLEHAGLISRGRDAQRRLSRIEGRRLADANAWLEGYRQFWEESFERLDLLLEEMKKKQGKAGQGKSRSVTNGHVQTKEMKSKGSTSGEKKHRRNKRKGEHR